VAAFDPSGVARYRNDVVDDDVLGRQVEEVPAVHQSGYASLNDPKERVQGLEVVEVADRCHQHSSTAQLVAVLTWMPLKRPRTRVSIAALCGEACHRALKQRDFLRPGRDRGSGDYHGGGVSSGDDARNLAEACLGCRVAVDHARPPG
jgi:hypothetical protein